ncbi:MAG: preprotein translocase subunit YajC [Planctomycetes bacterium]|nr:preprotein translocase subunit YajC [Planctomycetota bacterium]
MDFLFLMQAKAPGGNFMTLLVPFALMFAIMYFLILRPQKRKEKDRLNMIENVRKNDRIITSGGVHGVVVSVKEKVVVVRVDDAKDVKLKIDKSAVTSVTFPKDNQEEIEQN